MSTWLVPIRHVSKPEITLLCFPYAGGSSRIYHPWRSVLPEHIELLAVELPGRGKRIRERFAENASDIAQAVALELLEYGCHQLVLFGYSMGAILAYELACLLNQRGLEPHKLIVAAKEAPPCPPKSPLLHEMPDHSLIDKLVALGGIPLSLLQAPDLLQFFLPMVKADLKLVETYRRPQERLFKSLSCPIVAYVGNNDPLTQPDNVELWKNETAADFQVVKVHGNHFILNESEHEFLDDFVARF